MTTPMNPAVKALWVADLLRPDIQQGQGRLRDGGTFCCLGRLCEVYREHTGDGEWESIAGEQAFVIPGDYETGILPCKVKEWAGLEYQNPYLAGEVASDYNDGDVYDDDGVKRPFTFPEIAALIDANL